MIETEWSKQEKEIALRAFSAAYECECISIAHRALKMMAEINEPSDIWEIHDCLTEKRKETDQKYDFRYSVLLFVFARLICEGWVREEDLNGLSGKKLQEIRRIVELISGI